MLRQPEIEDFHLPGGWCSISELQAPLFLSSPSPNFFNLSPYLPCALFFLAMLMRFDELKFINNYRHPSGCAPYSLQSIIWIHGWLSNAKHRAKLKSNVKFTNNPSIKCLLRSAEFLFLMFLLRKSFKFFPTKWWKLFRKSDKIENYSVDRFTA